MTERDRVLVICEQGRAWERRLRPELSSARLWVCNQEEQLADLSRESPQAAWLLVCREDRLTAVLAATWRRTAAERRHCTVVVLPHHLACHAAWFFRAGAAWVHTDWRSWHDLWRVFHRHWDDLPQPKTSRRDAIWDRLPWDDGHLQIIERDLRSDE